MPFGIGLDMVEVESVAESLATHGERYLARVYTDAELRDSGRDPRRLAARFAAKEAVIKALGSRDRAVPWTSIEVHAGAVGRASVELSGAAARLAAARRVVALELSITERVR